MEKKAKLNIVEMKIGDLRPADYNPRKISADARIGLDYSIKKHGYVQNIIFNKRTGTLVSGHQRVDILESQGYTSVDVNVVDLSPEEEKVLNVEMNNHMIEGQFTKAIVDILEEISDFDPETFDTTMMFGLINDSDFADAEDAEDEDDENPVSMNDDIERMELNPFESYDYIMILCDDTQDFNWLAEKFGLERLNMSPLGGKKKIGISRIVSARQAIGIISKKKVEE